MEGRIPLHNKDKKSLDNFQENLMEKTNQLF